MSFSKISFTKTRVASALVLVALLATVGFTNTSISAIAPQKWPSIELPDRASSYDIGDQVSINGVPMKMRGFVVKQDLATTVAWFKAHSKQPLVEDQFNNTTVLGQAQGEHYITIQLEAFDGGVNGLIGISDMRQAQTQKAQSDRAKEEWLRDLPSDTQIINLMSSSDEGKESEYILATNQQSDSSNIDRGIRALEKRGFAVERRQKLERGTTREGVEIDASGQSVFFKSGNREATLLAFHNESGRAAIVINTSRSGK